MLAVCEKYALSILIGFQRELNRSELPQFSAKAVVVRSAANRLTILGRRQDTYSRFSFGRL